jgi:hypothetical protein
MGAAESETDSVPKMPPLVGTISEEKQNTRDSQHEIPDPAGCLDQTISVRLQGLAQAQPIY